MKSLRQAFALLFASVASTAFAWGMDGHRIIGAMAFLQLTPTAKVRLHELVPGSDLADISTYLDEERLRLKRRYPKSSKWHYEDTPVCGIHQERCEGGDCVSQQTERWLSVLADRNADRDERVFALKAVTHLVGDLHNPLHASDANDRGGNDIAVGSRSLHSEWDTGLVKKLFRGQSWERYAESLIKRYGNKLPGYATGSVVQWRDESHQLARDIAYGKLPSWSCGSGATSLSKLPEGYISIALPVIEVQLVRASARLAATLNEAFVYGPVSGKSRFTK